MNNQNETRVVEHPILGGYDKGKKVKFYYNGTDLKGKFFYLTIFFCKFNFLF